MEFQLPSVLQKKLTPYDEVRRKVEAEKKKAVRKASKPFHLGLPPLDLLIPNDVLPKNYNREELIKRISTNELKYRYLDLTYPEEKGYEGEITHQNGKPLTFKLTDRLVHSSTGKRVQRRILLYHFEGMWTCLWIPHTNKYVYGYSFAFKDNKSTQVRFESHPSRDYSPNRKVFCRKCNGKYMTREDRDGKNANPNYFDGWSWNECEQIKVGKTDWRYKTVYVTKEMIKNGHHQDPTCGMFFARPIGDGNREKDYHISKYLEHFNKVLRKSIPQWKPEYNNRRGYWHGEGAYRSKDNKMFDRVIRNSIGSVMKDITTLNKLLKTQIP